jgi:hypothetical protein
MHDRNILKKCSGAAAACVAGTFERFDDEDRPMEGFAVKLKELRAIIADYEMTVRGCLAAWDLIASAIWST